jgi:hypothetical protein
MIVTDMAVDNLILRSQVAALQADYDAEVAGRAQDYEDGCLERLGALRSRDEAIEALAAEEQYRKDLVRTMRAMIRKGKNMILGAGASTPHGERRELHWAIETAEALLRIGE